MQGALQHAWFSLKVNREQVSFNIKDKSAIEKHNSSFWIRCDKDFFLNKQKKKKPKDISKPVEILWSTSLSIAKYIWPGESAIFNTEKNAVKMSYYFPKFIFTYCFFYLNFKR